MLRGNGDVHMWIRHSWRSISDAPFNLDTCHGMGHLCGWDNGDHGRNLCVPGFLSRQRRLRSFALDAYANHCFPNHPGEISALLNLARMLGGFSVAYYQVPWAIKYGALQTLGCEAAYVIFFAEHASCLIPHLLPHGRSIVAGLFFLIVLTLQLTGRTCVLRIA